ncbi:hypothetical protein [Bradyrhizobium sp. 191]|uniref:hypothetical protein n=1 Tax=Bradyrhizobium sp. 191 TaxID=2782659 RepID=UPI001FFF077F|nr:hypothetical protein [Bradyrhizobium sp. 191]UPJ63006.1 hypothetical protein IVB23_23560 [Bradyrhizobium sp. 191]
MVGMVASLAAMTNILSAGSAIPLFSKNAMFAFWLHALRRHVSGGRTGSLVPVARDLPQRLRVRRRIGGAAAA